MLYAEASRLTLRRPTRDEGIAALGSPSSRLIHSLVHLDCSRTNIHVRSTHRAMMHCSGWSAFRICSSPTVPSTGI